MLKFVSSYLALGYLAFAALVVIGVLQALAASRSIAGLALLDYRRPAFWRRAFGPLVIVAAYAWFFGTWRELLTPGPAGLELTVLFAGSVLLALGITLLGASLLRPYRHPLEPATLPAQVKVRDVSFAQDMHAQIFTAEGQKQPAPGVCLVADPTTPHAQLRTLAGRLAQQGVVVLLPVWETARQRYPDALSLVPACLSFLSENERIDRQRLGVLGTNLGGDLALRAAAADHQVRAVAALAPLLEERNAHLGLGLLHEMTLYQALRWWLGGRRRQLIRRLQPLEAIARTAPRPVLIMYGDQDALVPLPGLRPRLEGAGLAVQVRIVPNEGHLSIVSSRGVGTIIVAQWLAEQLSQS